MRDELEFKKDLSVIARELKEEACAHNSLGELSVSDIRSMLLNVGRTVVQEVSPDTVINPALVACNPLVHPRVEFSNLTVAGYIEESESCLRDFVVSEKDQFYIVSWSGVYEHPLGIKLGTHTLNYIEQGYLYDIHDQQIGICDHIAENGSTGYAILVILPSDKLVENL